MSDITNLVAEWIEKYDSIKASIEDMRKKVLAAEANVKELKPKRNEDFTSVDRVKRQIIMVTSHIERAEQELSRRLTAKEQLQIVFMGQRDEEHDSESFKRKNVINNCKLQANFIRNKRDWQEEIAKLKDFVAKTLDPLQLEVDDLCEKADSMNAAIVDGAKEEAQEKIADLRRAAANLDDEIAKTQKRIDDLTEKLKDPKFTPEDVSKIINDLAQQQAILDTLKSHKENLIA